MESAESQVRLRVVLGKFQVVGTSPGLSGIRAKIDLGNSVTAVMDCPFTADIRVGDWLTFYTEVFANAQLSTPPVQ